ncbi:MAG: undecaprenyldiphospho-muramoylpentapeptide beta-N-acetylglucosaminyltransferase [Clostridia bacterium]|nr:undecaprenyldiphospho-muramoylpentapeptide beta-N-acetylglucosaminyltransferase [Clostridia bacterium]
MGQQGIDRVVITGGGTGGHIYPGLAVAKELKNQIPGVKLLYVGAKDGMEKEIVPGAGFDFEGITVGGLERRLSIKNIQTFYKLAKGFVEARSILKNFKPDVVMGTGGYVSFPVVQAAARRKIPTLIHEQNAFPGLANRMLAKRVDRVCISYGEAVPYFHKRAKIDVTGLPVRDEILTMGRQEALDFFDLKKDKLTLLVVGGSRGARSINRAVKRIIQWVAGESSKQLILITGKLDYQEVIQENREFLNSENIRIYSYLDRMEYGLAAADLVVSRAGATFLSELTARGVPGILIPYPHAADNHQEFNARSLEKHGAAKVVLDSQLKDDMLLRDVKELLNPEILNKMAENSRMAGKPRALDAIIGIILEMLN